MLSANLLCLCGEEGRPGVRRGGSSQPLNLRLGSRPFVPPLLICKAETYLSGLLGGLNEMANEVTGSFSLGRKPAPASWERGETEVTELRLREAAR